MKRWITRLMMFAVVALVLAGVYKALQPLPLDVEAVAASRGDLDVVVESEGKTRAEEVYAISAPAPGILQRIELEPGDPVEQGKTVLARILPPLPAMLDERARAEAKARVGAAEAATGRARALVESARTGLEDARVDLARNQDMRKRGAITRETLQTSEYLVKSRTSELTAAEFAAKTAAFELELSKAALERTATSSDGGGENRGPALAILSPVTGKVLRVHQESERSVTPGTPLIDVGDPAKLEVIIDVLSQDAARVRVGQTVRMEDWGGTKPLEGTVTRIEPSGFTKVSALGVEEQRVNVLASLKEAPTTGEAVVGEGYRVQSRIVVWEGRDILKIPTSALFRIGDDWAVFRLASGTARLARVEIGHRSDREAEVLAGLAAGDVLALYPGDRLRPDAPVQIKRVDP